MRNGYYQMSVKESALPKTASITPKGHCEFLRMPFGLATAPHTFQCAVSNIFRSNPNVLVFLDDLLIHDKSIEKHTNNLENVFFLLKHHNILLNLRKCEFFLTKVNYLVNYIERKDQSQFRNGSISERGSSTAHQA